MAAGRDCDVFEHGPGLVLRRARDGRSLDAEVAVMRWVAAHDYPVPLVHEAAGPEMVMERLDGPRMLDDVVRHPWRLVRHARTLATLHGRLATLPAADWMRQSHFPGDGIVHLDLHPLNVLITDRGPVVIDWTNAGQGDPAADIASTWMISVTTRPGKDELPALVRAFVTVGRHVFLQVFLRGVDREAGRRWLAAMGEYRKRDRNTRPEERERIDRLVAREGR
ncbi:MAG: phosphotransferase [Acidimicrobiales bacterium]